MIKEIDGRTSVLIAGGYGIVGAQVAELLASRNPELEIIIGGRSEAAAAAAAERIDGARGARVDIDEVDPLAKFAKLPDAIIAVANDGHDRLLRAAVTRGIAYVDITRWTERMQASILRLAPMRPTAPVLFSSGWMAGVTATVAAADARNFGQVSSIDIDILYALKDKAGPNSLDYVDRLLIPFPVTIDGNVEMKKSMSEPRAVRFSGDRLFNTYRFDTPEQYTLVHAIGAASVSSRLSYDNASAINSMRFLINSGAWKLLSLSIFDKLRRSMLYNPGEGDAHEVVIETHGTDPAGRPIRTRSTILDPLGQTHMTAVGAVTGLERVLGLRKRQRAPIGVSLPEHCADLDATLRAFAEMGVEIHSVL